MNPNNYAGLKKRAAATLLDFLVIAGYAAVLAILTILLLLTTPIERRVDSPWIRDLVAFVTLILPVILYFAIQESSTGQATIGKKRMRLKVIDQSGGRLGLGRALLRSGLKFLPWQLAHTTVFQIWAGNTSPFLFGLSILAQILVVIYLLTLWLGKQHRALYDWLAGTSVVNDFQRRT